MNNTIPLRHFSFSQRCYRYVYCHFLRRQRTQTVTSYGWMIRYSSPVRKKYFSLLKTSRIAQRPTQPPIQWVSESFFAGLKRPRRDADHSTPPSAEVKNRWNYTSIPPTCFRGVCRENLTILSFLFVAIYELYVERNMKGRSNSRYMRR